jgi:hypothetical protein
MRGGPQTVGRQSKAIMRNRSIVLLILSLLLGACAPLTKEEKAIQAVEQGDPQSADSPEECMEILETQPWCSIVKSAKHIERPEWTELFPSTEFYLVAYDLLGGEFQQSHNVLVVEQNGQRYRAETFDNLLDTNQIILTDQNLELVSKALALMTLEDYLDQEVVFTDWQAGRWEGRFTYDHYLKAWTKLQGIEFWWWFTFEDGQLKYVTRDGISDYHIGDYIDVSEMTLPLPPLAAPTTRCARVRCPPNGQEMLL